MPTRTGCHSNQSISALFYGLLGKAVVDDIVDNDTAIGMDSFVYINSCAERCYDDGNFVLHAQFNILHQPVIGLVNDLVDSKRSCRFVWISLIIGVQFPGNTLQPLFQYFYRARVESWKRSDDTGFTLRDDQVWIGNNEQR